MVLWSEPEFNRTQRCILKLDGLYWNWEYFQRWKEILDAHFNSKATPSWLNDWEGEEPPMKTRAKYSEVQFRSCRMIEPTCSDGILRIALLNSLGFQDVGTISVLYLFHSFHSSILAC